MVAYEVCMNSSRRARSFGVTCGPVRAVFLEPDAIDDPRNCWEIDDCCSFARPSLCVDLSAFPLRAAHSAKLPLPTIAAYNCGKRPRVEGIHHIGPYVVLCHMLGQ